MQTCWLSDQQAVAKADGQQFRDSADRSRLTLTPVERRQPKSPWSHQLRSPV